MNSARLAKMQCPNCENVGTIEIDDYEAQMYCTECCLVLAMNLGESEQTRYDGDDGLVAMKEVKGEDGMAVEEGSGGGRRNAPSSFATGAGGGRPGVAAGKKNEAIFDFIQFLQRKANLPDPVAVGAVALYSQFIDKLMETTGKANIGGDGGQNAVASAVVAITAARKGKTIPLAELSKFTKELSERKNVLLSNTNSAPPITAVTESQWEKNILRKRSDIARVLRIEDEIRQLDLAEFDHLSFQFHVALGWPLLSCKPAAAFAKHLNREISNATAASTAVATPPSATSSSGGNNTNAAASNTFISIAKVEAVAVGMYMTRASKKLSSLLAVPPSSAAATTTPPPSTSEVLQSICKIANVEVTRMTSILKLLQTNKATFDKLLGFAVEVAASLVTPPATSAAATAPVTIGQKRERETENDPAGKSNAAGDEVRVQRVE